MSEYIKIRKWPADHAQEAYDAGYYVEALQTLHGWMEVKLRELLHLQRAGPNVSGKDKDWVRSWNMSNDLSLTNIAKALFIVGALPEDTLNRILNFNRVRNNLIHKLYFDPYDEPYPGIPKEEYDTAFRDGIDLGYIIENMSAERV